MSGRRVNGTGEASGTPPHRLVRDLESSIATRLTAAERARDDVTQAQTRAQAVLDEAETQASETGRRRATAILTAARAEADQLVADGVRVATALTAAAAHRRDHDVTSVLSSVLPTAGAN